MKHITNIAWRPGFNDPDLLGWITFAAYGIASSLCLRAALRREDSPRARQAGRAWLLFGLALGCLGVNEQLDLQTLLIQWGRQIAEAGGWYEDRRLVQRAFMAIFSGAIVAAAIFACRRFRTFVMTQRLAVAGALLIAGYVLVRDASLNHIAERDESLWNVKDSLRLVELAGVTAIGLAAWKYSRSAKDR